MKKIIITLMILGLILLVGCEQSNLEPDCSSKLVKCEQELTKENQEWVYDLECDEWEFTGKTLYRETSECTEYIMGTDNVWNDMFELYDKIDVLQEECESDYGEFIRPYDIYYLENTPKSCLKFRELYIYEQEIKAYKEVCNQEPYQEKVCIHKKVVGIKLK